MPLSTFNNTPLDVLLTIFRELSRYNLNECQFVCKLWHKAANLLLVQEPRLLDNTQANKFLEYIKCHPTKRAEIKRLTLKGSPCAYYDKQCLTLDDDLCQLIVENCPQVENVVYSSRDRPPTAYYKLLYDLRNSLTTVKIGSSYDKKQFGHFADYLAKFPKLSSLAIYQEGVHGIEDLLPLFLKTSHLKELDAQVGIYDNGEFIKTQSAENQKLIVERLAQIENFDVQADPNVEMVKFIKEYFTGLKKIRVTGCIDPEESTYDEYHLPSLTTFTEYACTLLEHKFDVEYIQKEPVYERLPGIMQSVYYTVPSNVRKVRRMFHVKTEEEYCNTMPRRGCPFDIHTSSELHGHELLRTVGLVFVLYPHNRVEFARALDMKLPLQDVDILKFAMKDGEPTHRTFAMFKKLLYKMPAVTKVILEVRNDIFEKYKGYQKTTHPNVTDLEIISLVKHKNEKKKLIGVVSMFPNIKQLKLTRFCGICTAWENWTRCEYTITLEKTELETLSVDMNGLQMDSSTEPGSYFMLSVEVKDRRAKRFYKVSQELLRLEEIQEREFKQPDLSKLHIKIKNMKCLTIFRTRELAKEISDLIETNICF